MGGRRATGRLGGFLALLLDPSAGPEQEAGGKEGEPAHPSEGLPVRSAIVDVRGRGVSASARAPGTRLLPATGALRDRTGPRRPATRQS